MRIVVGLVALTLFAGCKKEGAATPAGTNAPAEPSPAKTLSAPASPPGTPALAVGPAGATAGDPAAVAVNQVMQRNKEIERLAAEIPAESEGGDSPEATAKAFALGVAKGDRAVIKDLVFSKKDMESMLDEKMLPRGKEGVARVLYKVGRALGRTVEVLGFKPGETKVVKPGEHGFKNGATLIIRSQLEVKIDGKPGKLRFRSMVKVGDRWKISAL